MTKRHIFYAALGVLSLSSCVTLTEHESLLAKYNQTEKSYNLARQELDEIKAENALLTRQNSALTSDYADLAATKNRCDITVDSLTRRLERLRHHYDTTLENYTQEVAGKNRDLTRAQNLLTACSRKSCSLPSSRSSSHCSAARWLPNKPNWSAKKPPHALNSRQKNANSALYANPSHAHSLASPTKASKWKPRTAKYTSPWRIN